MARPQGALRLPVHGEHMVTNACLAAAVGVGLGLTLEECEAGLAKTTIPGNRLKIQRLGRVLVINDAYNANPESMVAALRTAAHFAVKGASRSGAWPDGGAWGTV